MPTALILVFTIFIMVTVIPYAFSSVLKQMEAVRAMEAAGIEKYIKHDKLAYEFLQLNLQRSSLKI